MSIIAAEIAYKDTTVQTTTLLDADGTEYVAPLTVLDADGTSYVITSTLLDADGTEYVLVSTLAAGTLYVASEGFVTDHTDTLPDQYFAGRLDGEVSYRLKLSTCLL